jgi:hypothetical protein
MNWGPAASLPEIYEEEDVGTRRSSLAKLDTHDTPQEAALYVVCFATPRVGTPLILPSTPPSAGRSNYPSQYRRIIAETE